MASADTSVIAAVVDDFATAGHSPSGIVAVARHGVIQASRSWGEDGYDVSTPFRVASCTKSFTALALLILRRQGRIGLDDAVVDHLRELRVDAPSDWPTLRVRHLLGMSAGLATDNPWGDRQESRTRDELSAMAAGGLRLVFPPGSAFEYSNLGYALLGEIIARLSGTDYRAYVREQIIDPLGLRDTRFAADELPTWAPGYHREPAVAGQPGGWTAQPASGPGAFSSIGGLYASVRDLSVWAQLHLSREVPAGVAFTAADLREARQPLTHIASGPAGAPLYGTVTAGYACGLFVQRYSDHGTVVMHSGGYPGHTAFMAWHVESGYAVFASANGTHSEAPVAARQVLVRLVARADMEREAVPAWPETLAAAQRVEDLVRQVAAAPDTPSADLVARYGDLFAENVELDVPLARRVDFLKQGLVTLGALLPRAEPLTPDTPQPSCASWTVPAQHGRLVLEVELEPLAPFRVQTFTAEVKSGSVRFGLF